ncbi:MAG: hypothetical protein ACRDK7_05790 [Solirubrobacteraceae bacterium]
MDVLDALLAGLVAGDFEQFPEGATSYVPRPAPAGVPAGERRFVGGQGRPAELDLRLEVSPRAPNG